MGVGTLLSKTGWAWVGARARPALSEVLRSANELSAYEFSMYGTRYGGSILNGTHLDALSILLYFIGLHSLQ